MSFYYTMCCSELIGDPRITKQDAEVFASQHTKLTGLPTYVLKAVSAVKIEPGKKLSITPLKDKA